VLINVLCIYVYKRTLQYLKSRKCERLWCNEIEFQMVPVILSSLIISELRVVDLISKAAV